jgi:hypothetical protein
MSDIVTKAQAGEIADQLVTLAELISDFRFKNFADLSTEDSQNLRLMVSSIRRQASDLTALSIGQKIANIQDNLKAIAEATNEAEKALSQIQEIRKAFDIAAAIIRLGAAVITLNPTAIIESASNLIDISH